MAMKVYFMINVAEEFHQDDEDYQDKLRELEAIPEVKSVEPVSGVYDLVVQAEAPVRAIFVANKILPKKWVKRLIILRVEPPQLHKNFRRTVEELLGTQTTLRTQPKPRVLQRV